MFCGWVFYYYFYLLIFIFFLCSSQASLGRNYTVWMGQNSDTAQMSASYDSQMHLTHNLEVLVWVHHNDKLKHETG